MVQQHYNNRLLSCIALRTKRLDTTIQYMTFDYKSCVVNARMSFLSRTSAPGTPLRVPTKIKSLANRYYQVRTVLLDIHEKVSSSEVFSMKGVGNILKIRARAAATTVLLP